jgi:hypothetical protein
LGPALAQAAGQDPDLFRALLDIVGCLQLPTEVLARPGLAERALRLAADQPPAPVPGPDREQLLRLLA